MQPRVLVVAPRLDIGGAEMHLARVLPELKRAGIDVSLFVIARGGRLESKLTGQGVAILGPAREGRGLLHSVRAGLALRRAVRELRPDIVHFFLPEAYLVGAIATLGMPGVAKIMSRRSLD